jgi:hypothetical protein
MAAMACNNHARLVSDDRRVLVEKQLSGSVEYPIPLLSAMTVQAESLDAHAVRKIGLECPFL